MSSRHSSSWIDTNIFEYKIHTTINTSGVPTSLLFTSRCCRRWKTFSRCLVKSMHHHDCWNFQTHHLINEEAFAKMKDDVVLVNTRWTSSWSKNNRRKGSCQKRFSGFCPLRVSPPPPPPHPLNGKSFCQKTLNGIGGYPPPLTENPKKKFKRMGQKGLKLAFLGQK